MHGLFSILFLLHSAPATSKMGSMIVAGSMHQNELVAVIETHYSYYILANSCTLRVILRYAQCAGATIPNIRRLPVYLFHKPSPLAGLDAVEWFHCERVRGFALHSSQANCTRSDCVQIRQSSAKAKRAYMKHGDFSFQPFRSVVLLRLETSLAHLS